jgi:hypothetical protein
MDFVQFRLRPIRRFQYNAASFLFIQFEGGLHMNKLWGRVSAVGGTLLMVGTSTVLANEPKGGAPDYSGISSMYYALIGVVLAYGVYDTFFKKS